jgi:hypothetical protein
VQETNNSMSLVDTEIQGEQNRNKTSANQDFKLSSLQISNSIKAVSENFAVSEKQE